MPRSAGIARAPDRHAVVRDVTPTLDPALQRHGVDGARITRVGDERETEARGESLRDVGPGGAAVGGAPDAGVRLLVERAVRGLDQRVHARIAGDGAALPFPALSAAAGGAAVHASR